MSGFLARMHPRSLVGSPALWGKLPCRGDFIRLNLKHEEEYALQDWVSAKHPQLSAATSSFTPVSEDEQKRLVLPWCFVLSPGCLAFNPQHYLMGVWMESSDKIGREYPFVMFQKALPNWTRLYFEQHAHTPSDWLFHAARMIAETVHAGEQENVPSVLVSELRALWRCYAPGWQALLKGKVAFPDKSILYAKGMTGKKTFLDDSLRLLDGVRYLPWADWPGRLSRPPGKPYEIFWQQNLNGRFINAIQN